MDEAGHGETIERPGDEIVQRGIEGRSLHATELYLRRFDSAGTRSAGERQSTWTGVPSER